jgi:hypothetical protein
MPGGKSSITSFPPDLASFISRRRGTVNKWLILNNITSPEALQALVAAGNWHISQDLYRQIAELVKPISVATQTPVEVVVAPQEEKVVIVPEPTLQEEVIEHLQPVTVVSEVVEEQPVEQQPVPDHNDVNLEDIPVFSPKERKKSR